LDMDSFLNWSKTNKKSLANLLNIDPDIGYIKLGETEKITPYEALVNLYRDTVDIETKNNLNKIMLYIPKTNINCKYVHKNDAKIFLSSVNKTWTDNRNDSMAIAKLLSSVISEKFSQVFSKIYSSKQGESIYLSIRPMDYLMISDKDSTKGWSSCHNSVEGDYRRGNVNYGEDQTTAIVFIGNPDYEEYTHSEKNYYDINDSLDEDEDYNGFKLEGINPSSRMLIHLNKNVVLGNRVYHGKITLNQKAVVEKVYEILGHELSTSQVTNITYVHSDGWDEDCDENEDDNSYKMFEYNDYSEGYCDLYNDCGYALVKKDEILETLMIA